MKVERVIPPPVEPTYSITGLSLYELKMIQDAITRSVQFHDKLGNVDTTARFEAMRLQLNNIEESKT